MTNILVNLIAYASFATASIAFPFVGYVFSNPSTPYATANDEMINEEDEIFSSLSQKSNIVFAEAALDLSKTQNKPNDLLKLQFTKIQHFRNNYRIMHRIHNCLFKNEMKIDFQHSANQDKSINNEFLSSVIDADCEILDKTNNQVVLVGVVDYKDTSVVKEYKKKILDLDSKNMTSTQEAISLIDYVTEEKDYEVSGWLFKRWYGGSIYFKNGNILTLWSHNKTHITGYLRHLELKSHWLEEEQEKYNELEKQSGNKDWIWAYKNY